ncbi:alpha/beta hydrolase family protein [Halioxenophilus aromaticivorans]|uniref:Dienelactone hydrolase family protein n=1 Tax=Halioxenophilus aromaticivorans TaxID=1306992 RepID=A0AAV3U5I8_9ALTE
MKYSAVIALCLLLGLAGCNKIPHEQQSVSIPVPGTDLSLAGTVIWPEGEGPFPLAILNHGTSSAANRAKFNYWRKPHVVNALIERGFAVLIPMRRGFGATGGEYRATTDGCAVEHPNFYEAGIKAGEDIVAAINFAPTIARVNSDRIILVGHSAGGYGAIAAASMVPGKVAAVANFGGGRGGRYNAWGEPCHPKVLAEAITRYTQSITAPVLWYYAENDRFFSPKAATQWFDAYTAAGGKGALVIGPAFKDNGHSILMAKDGIPIWTPSFDQFLKQYGLINSSQ